MGKRHGKEVPVTVLPRRAPPQALAKPPVLPARQARPKSRVVERRERHPPGARLSSRNATYQGDDGKSDSEQEDEDEGGDEEREEEDDEGDGYAEALKLFEFSESVSASESDDRSDNNEEPWSGNPSEEDKLALLREFVFQGNDWYKGLRRGRPQNRDMRFWEKVLRSLGKPRPFSTWAQAAATFRRVIGPRRAKANNGTRAKKPLAGPEGEKDRLIDKCIQICSQRDILEDFVGRGYIKQRCIREIVRDGSLECILKGLLADHFGGAHAGQDHNRRNERAEDRAAEHGDGTDGDGPTSESGESDAANNSSEWEEPRDGYHTPASSPPLVRSVRVQHRSKKRGREENETVSEEEPLSKRIAAGFAKIIQESEKADLAMRRKRETEIMEKVEAMMAGLGKGKAREM
ncbi:hypothetical protein GGTG_10391 [Gaeumannomyces tritici R3-111a-1]|uniref:Uncharacterized protein n=1 Tax=Gaeumannomyces tritici (strain R3-111a-1) TaxID=644352 RepID=J3PA65_GAET3|nr:hypothetical protein GGTG_10391 [Gaeumannomyces tritici R3-111a-1]EJT71131.1 hypothetical protein GGTG_10391 [Gaeumannomyces tritici R3-111a-1]